ncbi:hypothetical protein [Helicobacter pametensis]|uniref:hypothetical protein n=1 Tax=Helicobacter pametensis TaxID=95149 RepID=UPI0004BC4C1E|nr:hypothetical protein [Helicobacter pametensis]
MSKKPCIFCIKFKLNKINLLLIVLMCLVMYWVNQYQMRQIDLAQTTNVTQDKARSMESKDQRLQAPPPSITDQKAIE